MRPYYTQIDVVSDGSANLELKTQLQTGGSLYVLRAVTVCDENKNNVQVDVGIIRDNTPQWIVTVECTKQGLYYAAYPKIMLWSDNRIVARFRTTDSGDKLHFNAFLDKVG
jgi:hypothetical protein